MHLWLFVAEVALLFTLLLAGWSNVAIGLGRLAGETPPENLRRPWLAPSVVEFWRRWHASLATWLRDYVSVPLGGGRRATLRNVAVTFLVAAGWYGWTITKILGYGGYPPRAWRRLLLCALFNAVAVAGVHVLGRGTRDAPVPGALGTAWRVGATAAFVSLAWLPLMLPLWNRLPDLAAVYLRLFFLR
jgi:D-alanyl-lipoteichoic acid acyltransferase DltB (MBOAT superfamily)